MKTSTLIVSFILLAFSTTSFSEADVLLALDTDGDFLTPNTEYYILPVTRGRGGGLVTVRARNKTCPLDVGQARSELDRGFPVIFTPSNSKVGYVSTFTNLNIRFPYIKTTCLQSNVWTLDNDDGELVVSTGGVEGKPGHETSSDWFQIENNGDYYKFVYCPTVCNTCRPVCEDIGISIKNGIRRLAISKKPFKVMFKKAVV